ncbi:hypothetical protein [Robertmurraya kyonggiensis]|uniref:Uncharacterized protein n=1 Tax=Robertmurraya kyonggiensis TaxID=1037680 RepID=A0A4U1CZR9_9BACI|nr:hypothetical protein [Robertmurraya kyonggiensis]TKC15402.1 hypothetical protein FA727_18430 [Robertmurraya kyonggiensis]
MWTSIEISYTLLDSDEKRTGYPHGFEVWTKISELTDKISTKCSDVDKNSVENEKMSPGLPTKTEIST